jgi:hypothetical protein
VRGEDKGVIHLHGYWDSPETIVLSAESYEKVLGSEHTQELMRALRMMRTLVFVGFGEGLCDPNFEAFFDWSTRVFAGSESRIYRLCRHDEIANLRSQHLGTGQVLPIGFGNDYDDLSGFIASLSPVTAAARRSRPLLIRTLRDLRANISAPPRFELRGMDWYEEADTPYFHGRTRDITAVRRLLIDYPVVRLAGPKRNRQIEFTSSWIGSCTTRNGLA